MIAGRYERGREIGRGGMGAVWLGHDTVLGREVALKQIGMIPGATAPDFERAGREARLAARLNHPHVVAVFDLVAEGDEHWLVMEYVEGVTLAALVKTDGALTPDEAGPLLRQVSDALAAAHGAGIVHRDVKPSNILVTRAGEVKLSDFGIARAEADASLTQTGLVTGSPAYLAPEVASGTTATEASDVWSLGATLYHALDGRPPYDVTENLMGALYRIVHEEPPRLVNAGWLTPLLAHTMTRDPADRWSMAQVRDFLAQGDDDVAVRPSPAVLNADDSTRIIQPTPAEPLAVPPIDPNPALTPVEVPVAGLAPASRPRRSAWPWVAAVVALVAVVVIAVAVLTQGTNDPKTPAATGTQSSPTTPRSSPTTTQSSPTTPQSSPTSSGTSPPAAAAVMRQFITGYLATVTSDPHASFQMLTPDFQAHSGGFGRYQGFWSTISSATPSNIHADPATLQVTYDVAYVRTNGTNATGHVTLHLVKRGSSYLIDSEG